MRLNGPWIDGTSGNLLLVGESMVIPLGFLAAFTNSWPDGCVIKRTLEISREPSGLHLATRDEQLLLLRRDPAEVARRLPAQPPNLAGQVPCEDIGVIMVDSRETTYSHTALCKLAEHGAAVVLCGHDHLPIGMFLPIATNSHLLTRLDAQLTASKPTLKRLWSSVVAAKVRAQAAALPSTAPNLPDTRLRLRQLARSIRSGDPDNVEATAAQFYWPLIFGRSTFIQHPFRREAGDRSAPAPNNLLDYGYAALRAAVARALVSAGLLPALGIKHRGRSNPFCLADDLMEPLRPMVDRRVRYLTERGDLTLDQSTKAEILQVLTDTTQHPDGTSGPLLVAMTRYVASFVRVLTGESEHLDIPIDFATRAAAADHVAEES